MARPLRIQYEGALYHIASRGNAKDSIFLDDQDRLSFLNLVSKVNQRYHFLCHAYCLMNNHYHLIIETPEGNLSSGMRQLNGVYTQSFNQRHQRPGHLFQGRYKAILIQKETHFLEVCRYAVLNPVRVKLVKDPEDWKWSSFRATAGLEKPHPCLTVSETLERWGLNRRLAQKRYREFVLEGIGRGSIWKEVRAQSLLGEQDFVDRLQGYLRGHEETKEISKEQRHLGRPGLRDLFSEEMLANKEMRNKMIREAVERYGYSQREVADSLGMHYSTISRLVNEKREMSTIKT